MLSILTITYIKSEQNHSINNLKIIVINSKINNLIKSAYTIYIVKYLYIDKFDLYLEYAKRKQ